MKFWMISDEARLRIQKLLGWCQESEFLPSIKENIKEITHEFDTSLHETDKVPDDYLTKD